MNETQEPKYRIRCGGMENCQTQIVNRSDGKPIPDDEHKRVVNERLHQFVDFAHACPDRMKEPDTDTDNE